jgi:hypothetical protein
MFTIKKDGLKWRALKSENRSSLPRKTMAEFCLPVLYVISSPLELCFYCPQIY